MAAAMIKEEGSESTDPSKCCDHERPPRLIRVRSLRQMQELLLEAHPTNFAAGVREVLHMGSATQQEAEKMSPSELSDWLSVHHVPSTWSRAWKLAEVRLKGTPLHYDPVTSQSSSRPNSRATAVSHRRGSTSSGQSSVSELVRSINERCNINSEISSSEERASRVNSWVHSLSGWVKQDRTVENHETTALRSTVSPRTNNLNIFSSQPVAQSTPRAEERSQSAAPLPPCGEWAAAPFTRRYQQPGLETSGPPSYQRSAPSAVQGSVAQPSLVQRSAPTRQSPAEPSPARRQRPSRHSESSTDFSPPRGRPKHAPPLPRGPRREHTVDESDYRSARRSARSRRGEYTDASSATTPRSSTATPARRHRLRGGEARVSLPILNLLLKGIKQFGGGPKDNVAAYIASVERVAESERLCDADTRRLATLTLCDTAAESLPARVESWSDIKTILTEKFGQSELEVETTFQGITQKKEEGVAEYSRRVRAAADRLLLHKMKGHPSPSFSMVKGIWEDQMIQVFRAGLLPALQPGVARAVDCLPTRPKLQDVIHLACNVERAVRSSQGGKLGVYAVMPASTPAAPPGPAPAQPGPAQPPGVRGSNSSGSYNQHGAAPAYRGENSRCYSCQATGHFARECSQLSQTTAPNGL